MGEWGLAGAPVSLRRSLRSGASRRPGDPVPFRGPSAGSLAARAFSAQTRAAFVVAY